MSSNKRPRLDDKPAVTPPPPPGSFDVTVVGSGVSTGVPMMNHILQGFCPNRHLYRKSDRRSVCEEALEPGSKNARSNVSILVRYMPAADPSDGAAPSTQPYLLMVDAGKTMRPACLNTFPKLGAMTIDALLLTHDHADAIFGLDDLRDMQQHEEVTEPETGKLIGYRIKGSGGAMRIVSNRATLQRARLAFPYLAAPADYVAPGLLRRRVAHFKWEQIPHDNASLQFAGLGVRCFPVYHGGTYISLGFAFGAAADGSRPLVYISDVKSLPEGSRSWLLARPIGVLIVDLLRRADHTTHFSFDEAVDFVKLVRPAKAFFVGMASCEVGDHDEVNTELRAICDADDGTPTLDMQLAYDGLTLAPMPTVGADLDECRQCEPCAPEGY